MDKNKARKIFVYIMLAFVIFLYLFTIVVFLFGDPETGVVVFAYSTFITVIVYFLIHWQRRIQLSAELAAKELENQDDQSS